MKQTGIRKMLDEFMWRKNYNFFSLINKYIYLLMCRENLFAVNTDVESSYFAIFCTWTLSYSSEGYPALPVFRPHYL